MNCFYNIQGEFNCKIIENFDDKKSIGIIIADYNIEKNKHDEFKNLFDDTKYLSCIDKENIHKFKHKKIAIGDILVYASLKCKNKNKYNVNKIYFDDKDLNNKLKDNLINFTLTYDLVEAASYQNYKKAIKYEKIISNLDNIYPDYNFQKFISNKKTYLTHFQNNDIPIIPFIYVNKNLSEKQFNDIKKKYKDLIVKPLFASDGIGFEIFINCTYNKINKYINKLLKQYPSVLIQPYIKTLDKTGYEVKLFYINNKFEYAIAYKGYGKDYFIGNFKECEEPLCNQNRIAHKMDLSKLPQPFTKYKKLAEKTINILPKIKFKGITLPYILLRIDIGAFENGDLFVNEIEFVPSKWLSGISKHIEKKIAQGVIEIIDKVKNIK